MKPKFQLGALKTANVVLKSLEPGYAQRIFDKVIQEYGNAHTQTKKMYENVQYALKFVNRLESLRSAYLCSETKILVGCFLYLYFWQTEKPMGSIVDLLPPFVVCDEEKFCEEDSRQINTEYECLYDFLRDKKQFVIDSCPASFINLSELKTYVSDVLKVWEENQSSKST